MSKERCAFSTEYYRCSKPAIACVDCGAVCCVIHIAYDRPLNQAGKQARCPDCNGRRLLDMPKKKDTEQANTVTIEQWDQADVEAAEMEAINQDEQEAARLVNGTDKDGPPTAAQTHLERLLKLDEELTRFDGVIEHHKSEMKEAREARDQVVNQMRALIRRAAAPLPLFDAKASAETSDEEESGEEPYGEEVGPSL